MVTAAARILGLRAPMGRDRCSTTRSVWNDLSEWTEEGRVNPRRRTVIVAAVALLAAGCQGQGDGEETTVGHLTLSVPEGWTEESASGKWDKKFVGDGIELQVSGTFSEDPIASTAFSRLDVQATTQLSDYQQTKALENPEVKGADSTYTEEEEQMEGIWILAGQWPYPSTAAIALSGESLDSAEVESIIDSLEFTTKEGTSG